MIIARYTKTFGVLVLLAGVFTSLAAQALDALSVSHEWPDGTEGKPVSLQHETAEVFAGSIEENGGSVRVYGDAGWFQPWEQWSALASNAIDVSMFPLIYAGNRHPEFNLTFMPGLISDHEHLARFNDSRAMQEIRETIRLAGIVVLADLWVSGGFVSRVGCVREPGDVYQRWTGAAGIGFNKMLAAAEAQIDTLPASHMARHLSLDCKGVDIAVMSSPEASQFPGCDNARECPVNCVTVPGDTPLWFMYQPLLMSKASWDAMSKSDQTSVKNAAQEARRFWEARVRLADAEFADRFAAAGVEVQQLSKSELSAWRDLAERSLLRLFREHVPVGTRLLKLANEDD